MTTSKRQAKRQVRWRERSRCVAAGVALLVSGVVPVHAELPVGWDVEIFAGRVHDLALHDGVLVGATDGGLLLHEIASGQFSQVADAGCTNGDCLRSNLLTAVDVDANGQIWVGTRASGVAALRSEVGGFAYRHFFASNFQLGGGLLADSVLAIDVWLDETVYVVTTSGVAQIDLAGAIGEFNEQSSRRPGQDGFPSTRVYDVAVDETFAWVASDSGVVRYARLPPHAADVLADSLVTSRVNVVEIAGGDVFAGTDEGVYRWQATGGFWSRVRSSGGATPDFPVRSLARLQDPAPGGDRLLLVAGSDREVRSFQGFVWGFCSPPVVPLIGDRTFPTMVAHGDTAWTSQGNAFGEGAFLERFVFSEGCAWTRFEPNSIPVSEVRYVDLAPDRDLWVGLRLAGVARRNGAGTWCAFNGNDPDVAANMTDPEGRVSAFAIDRGGSAWFTTLPINRTTTVDRLDADPACVHANDVWDHIDAGEMGFGGRYWRIAVDGEGNRFFLADEDPVGPGGMDVLSDDGLQVVNLRADLLGGNAVGAIAFENESGPWQTAYVGINNLGDQGLVRWRNSDDLFAPVAANFTKLSLGGTSVTAYRDMVFHPRTRQLWIGTDAGLIQYDTTGPGILRFLGQKSDVAAGLLSPDVKDLLIDDLDNLWIATANGLNRIDLGDSVLVIDAFSTREKINELNAGAGAAGILYLLDRTLAPLPGPRVNSLAYDTVENLLHIGTESGVATLDVEGLDAGSRIPIEKAVIYPNPVRVSGDTNDPNNPTERIFVHNVTTPVRVIVYNLEGQIVSEKRLDDPSVEAWDLKIFVNRAGTAGTFFNATSGVYMVRIESLSGGGSTMTPLVVIR